MFHVRHAFGSHLVVEVYPMPGEWVGPGTNIARIINLEKLRVEANVPANLAGQLSPGQRAEFIGHLGGVEMTRTALVTFVSPEIDPVNQDFKIWAEIENVDQAFLPGVVGELKLFGEAR